MNISSRCILCLLKKEEASIRACLDEEQKAQYLKDVMRIMLDADPADTMPWISDQIRLLKPPVPRSLPDYAKIKTYFNTVLMEMEPMLHHAIQQAPDPLSYTLRLARCGNYIDFGAMDHVDEDILHSLLKQVKEETLDADVYQRFLSQAAHSSSLLYLCDNCGEIVLDKLLILQLQKQFPHLHITVMVRGGEVLNDATMRDVRQIHLDEVCACTHTQVPLAGCDLRHIGKDARTLIASSDMIIAKGQANFESLYGCGLPIYYLLLCKCDYFCERFHMRHLEGIFAYEKTLEISNAEVRCNM